MDPTEDKTGKTVDIYRDTWVRFLVVGRVEAVSHNHKDMTRHSSTDAGDDMQLVSVLFTRNISADGPVKIHQQAGYANEVGEAFRALVPVSFVWGSYAVASVYVTADAVDKGKKAAVAHGDNPGKTTRVAAAVVDTFVWQALASVMIPGFTINRVCAASLHLLGRTTRWPLPVRKWTTTAIGLSTIPFIITPIDRSVDFLLDSSLRKVYNHEEKHK